MPTENLHNESNPFHKTILIKLRMFADKDRRATCVEWGSYFWGGNMCLFWVYTFLWRQKKSTAYARKIIGQILGVLRNGRKKPSSFGWTSKRYPEILSIRGFYIFFVDSASKARYSLVCISWTIGQFLTYVTRQREDEQIEILSHQVPPC